MLLLLHRHVGDDKPPQPHLINTDHVEIAYEKGGRTRLEMTSGKCWSVVESLVAIAALQKGA